jgi:fluoride exporter
MSHVLWLIAAGASGTLARVALSTWVQRQTTSGLPFGTAAVNLLGCFLFGLVFALASRHAQADTLRLVLLGGFMGAFTTFSSYMFDTLRLLQEGRTLAALLNLGLQNGLGLAGLMLGIGLGRAL